MNARKAAKKEDRKKLKEWAEAVKERDGFECIICGHSERLNAHHIIPREIKETRYELSNGATLCPRHHKYSVKLSAHRNPMAFALWLIDNRPHLWLNARVEIYQLSLTSRIENLKYERSAAYALKHGNVL